MITHMHNFNKKKKWALSAFITPKKKKIVCLYGLGHL